VAKALKARIHSWNNDVALLLGFFFFRQEIHHGVELAGYVAEIIVGPKVDARFRLSRADLGEDPFKVIERGLISTRNS
jgi:hypothetical protein